MKRWNLLYTFLFFLPILDVLSSITTRFYPEITSIGMIVKGLVVLSSIIYLLFINRSKYQKLSLYYLLIIFIFLLLYFILKIDLFNYGYFIKECKYLLKFIYFPILFITFLNLFCEHKFEQKLFYEIMISNIVMYLILIIVPTIFNIGFDSYVGENLGYIGFFYSANEVSTILLLLFPFIYLILPKNITIFSLLSIMFLVCLNLVGTKVSLFGAIILTFLTFICTVIKSKKINDKKAFISLCVFLFSFSFLFYGFAMHNFKNSINNKLDGEVDITNNEINNDELDIYGTLIEEVKESEEKQNNELLKKLDSISSIILSERNIYLKNTNYLFKENLNVGTILFGLGFSNTSRIRDYHVEKLIEIDMFDIFYHMGIIAIFIFIFPFIFTMKEILKSKKFNLNIFYIIMVIGLTLGISTLAGHVFLSPAVSIYIIIYFILLLDELNIFSLSKINNKKITFLALHLGFGGVENATINTANMLANKYDVEIISLYKKNDKIPYEVDKKVKIKYLMNTTSNREEFKLACSNKNIIKIFKEGFKAIYILYSKKVLMRKEILQSDALVIISTRYEFSKLLNKYGREEVIKIHQEHTYNIEEKYMKTLNNLNNIDYIMPVSKVLFNHYKKNINNKIKHIPLSLMNYPEELKYTKNKNIIAIGRLEKEKGFIDLIEVFNNVVKKDKKVFLNIFGDGSEKEKIKELISKYKLEENVCLHGFQEHKVINEYLKESSLYVMTSFEESFGLVLIEAMSYGIPCIAFDSAKGAKDIITKENGFFIKNRNIKSMTNKIEEYLNLPFSKQKQYRTKARNSIENYKKENVQKEWILFIDEVIDEKISTKNI